jgi:ATP-dependent RNA helicase HelY
LPAIDFIFSRAGCDAAVQQCVDAGIYLTNESERLKIRDVAMSACAAISPDDLNAVGFGSWLAALERGLAAHHAGMVPVFKEVVEKLFQLGLVKCVFATETLALGINMPARSVILERLVKWNGEAHVDLTPGEYTQITGRAGRRGIDVEGHAVVAWSDGFDRKAVAGLADALRSRQLQRVRTLAQRPAADREGLRAPPPGRKTHGHFRFAARPLPWRCHRDSPGWTCWPSGCG